MEAEIAQQNKIQSSIRQQNHLLQKTASELKDQVANLSIALRELQAEERQLNKEVVHSPDRIKADVHKIEKELEEVKRLIAKKEEERNLLAKMLKNSVKGEECVKRSIEAMEDMDEKVQQYEIAAEDADDLNANVDKIESSLEKKRSKKEELDVDIRAIGTCVMYYDDIYIKPLCRNTYYFTLNLILQRNVIFTQSQNWTNSSMMPNMNWTLL